MTLGSVVIQIIQLISDETSYGPSFTINSFMIHSLLAGIFWGTPYCRKTILEVNLRGFLDSKVQPIHKTSRTSLRQFQLSRSSPTIRRKDEKAKPERHSPDVRPAVDYTNHHTMTINENPFKTGKSSAEGCRNVKLMRPNCMTLGSCSDFPCVTCW